MSAGCGLRVVAARQTGDRGRPGRRRATESTENLLVLSWQPAFCETMSRDRRMPRAERRRAAGRPRRGCRSTASGRSPRADAYCDVPAALVELDQAGRWSKLPPVEVDAAAARRLRVAMPGTASSLDRHEWLKHGTCHRGAGGADGYFDDMLSLADAVNASPVAAFLADRVGAKVRDSDIRAAFDAAFGRRRRGAGGGRVAPTTAAGR